MRRFQHIRGAACAVLGLFCAEAAVFAGTMSDADRTKLLDVRSQTDLEFKNSPTSPLAAVKRIDLKKGEGSDVPDMDGKPWIHLDYSGGSYRLKLLDVSGVRVGAGDEELAESGKIYPSDSIFVADYRATRAYEQEGEGVVIVFDQRNAEFKGFSGLRYYEPDAAYVVPARLTRPATPVQETLPTSIERTKTFYVIGTLDFELNGQKLQLRCYSWDPKATEATIFFKDSTAGTETLPAGRYLEVSFDDNDSTTLDFNRAYNPYCAYTDTYNCPLPPKSNQLSVAIRAGEKIYPRVTGANVQAEQAPEPTPSAP